MYLGRLQIENFRRFESLDLQFQPGLNLLVGENDSGKTTIIEAIKFVTGTQSNDWNKLTIDDFYSDGKQRANKLKIICYFMGFSDTEAAPFLEWLSKEEGEFYLKLTLTGIRREKSNSLNEIFYDIKAGEDEEGGVISGEARINLKVTYLKALRDAEYELAPRRGSRLSQILSAHEIFQKDGSKLHPLEEAMGKANDEVKKYFEESDGKEILDIINITYLKEFSLFNNSLSAKLGIAQSDLGKILEKLEMLGISEKNLANIGLGSNNLLFIATEMLLLKRESGYFGLKLSLIEEIEAHLHPQLQLNLINFLDRESNNLGFQSIITTHSNTLASKVDLNSIIICKNSNAYSLRYGETELSKGDYNFLRRFLDTTKANLFFANGLLIVEGDAENLIIPSLAELIGYPLHKHGISIVNVGSTALLRYAKILQRKDNETIGIKVACISDRDIPPKEAKDFKYEIKKRGNDSVQQEFLIQRNRKTEDEYSPKEISEIIEDRRKKYEGGDVKLFISNTWTLEFEIARSPLRNLLHKSVLIAKATNNLEIEISQEIIDKATSKVDADILKWTLNSVGEIEIALEIFLPLEIKRVSKAVVAQIFAQILSEGNIPVTEILENDHLKYIFDAIRYVTNV